jgi:hypothetical protein
MGAHCLVLEADGAFRLDCLGRPTVRTLLFPASDATLLDTWRTIGLCGTASDSYCVNDARPPLRFHAVSLRDRGKAAPRPVS